MNSLALNYSNKVFDSEVFTNDIINLLGDSVYSNWFKSLKIIKANDHSVVLGVESRFVKEWIRLNYSNQIEKILKNYFSDLYEVEYVISENIEENSNTASEIENNIIPSEISKLNKVRANSYSNYTFANFITAKENLLAYTALENLVNNLDSNSPDILFIHGKVGVGKTHLLKAACNHINDHKNFTYTTGEKFVYDYVKSLKEGKFLDFKDKICNSDFLLIDDFQFFQAKQSSQKELLSLLDIFAARQKKVIIAANKLPRDLSKIDSMIISRLNAGLSLKIELPSQQLKANVLTKNLANENVEISETSIEKIANSAETIRDVLGFINNLKMYNSILKDGVCDAVVDEILADVSFSLEKQEKLDIEKIITIAATYFGVSKEDILSTKRQKNISKARHIGMYLAKEYTNDSLVVIAAKFSRINHSTVIHAHKKVKSSLKDYPEISEIKKKLFS